MAVSLVRPGGHVANVGVHGKPVNFHLENAWIQNITITTGLVNTDTARTLIKLLAQGRINVSGFVSHRFALNDIEAAYDTFGRAAETKALKVLMSA
jgi:alcohol dehydrogenase